MDAVADPHWKLLPHGRFRVRVLIALIQHHWFIRLRWVFATLATLLLLFERLGPGGEGRPWVLWVVVGAIFVVNAGWTLVGRSLRSVFASAESASGIVVRDVVVFVNAQMAVDIFLLTMILRFSGGVENPMAVFYLFHMLIAALLLKPLNALVQGAWALALYAALGIGECVEWIRPPYPFVGGVAANGLHTNWTYVLTGIAVLAAGIVGTLYFTLQISLRLDEQEAELLRSNDALRQSREAIEKLQDKRLRFLRTAAHQLKSPLTGIEMLAGLIRDGVVGADGVVHIVQRIIGRCREAIVQVGELLTLARIEQSSATRHRPSVTRVIEALEAIAARYRPQAEAKELCLATRFDLVEQALIAVERRDFEDCVGNLVDNAVKYTPAGGTVTLAAETQQGLLRLTVRDTGMGIATESLEEIFEPYHRGNAALAANIPGTGLGLSVVREVAEQAGGRIEVHSREGEGSEFVLLLPLAGPPTSAEKTGSSEPDVELEGKRGDGRAEDGEDIGCSIASSPGKAC